MAATQVSPRARRAKGYEMLPAEKALAVHFSIATHGWPEESRRMTCCTRKGCSRAATHHIGWRAWAKGFPKSSPHLTGVIGIPLCRECARDATADDLISDDCWQVISDAVAAQGRIRPDRNTLEIFAREGLPDRGGFEPVRRH